MQRLLQWLPQAVERCAGLMLVTAAAGVCCSSDSSVASGIHKVTKGLQLVARLAPTAASLVQTPTQAVAAAGACFNRQGAPAHLHNPVCWCFEGQVLCSSSGNASSPACRRLAGMCQQGRACSPTPVLLAAVQCYRLWTLHGTDTNAVRVEQKMLTWLAWSILLQRAVICPDPRCCCCYSSMRAHVTCYNMLHDSPRQADHPLPFPVPVPLLHGWHCAWPMGPPGDDAFWGQGMHISAHQGVSCVGGGCV
jgi:hypothetical protein